MNLNTKINIFNIQKFSLHDGPGIRTVVFFKGCPLKCKWCANPESQAKNLQISYDKDKCIHCVACVNVCPAACYKLEYEKLHVHFSSCIGCLKCAHVCPNGAISVEGEIKTIKDIIDVVMQDEPFYNKSGGGVTFSGGEVLYQANEAVTLANELHSRGIHIAIETSGFASKEHFLKLYHAVDLILFDLKHWNAEKHLEGTGCSNNSILHNLQSALAGDKPVLVRIPVIPEYNNTVNDAKEFAHLLKALGVTRVELLPFHQFGEKKYEVLHMPYQLKNMAVLKPKDIEEFRWALLENGLTDVQI